MIQLKLAKVSKEDIQMVNKHRKKIPNIADN